MRIHARDRHARRAFTLAELLMAVAIILILIALSAAAVLKFRTVGPFQATTANMNKIKKLLDAQWSIVVDKAKRDQLPSIPAELDQVKIKAGVPLTTAAVDPRVRDAYIQLRLAQALPMNFTEALNPSSPLNPQPVKPWPGYVNYLASLGVNAGNAATAAPVEVQQAICLLMALERGPSGVGTAADDIGGTSAIQKFQLPGGTAFGATDGWGTAMQFLRQTNGFLITSAGPDKNFLAVDDNVRSDRDL